MASSRRILSTIVSILLIAVFTLGALNVSTAGQRGRLRQKVQALTERVATLEDRVLVNEAFSVNTANNLFDRTQDLASDGGFHGEVTRNARVRPPLSTCVPDDPAIWRSGPEGLHLSC
jgi:hypothetical protein